MPNHSIDLMVKKHANRYLRQLNAKNLSDFSIPDQSHKRLLSVYADGERAARDLVGQCTDDLSEKNAAEIEGAVDGISDFLSAIDNEIAIRKSNGNMELGSNHIDYSKRPQFEDRVSPAVDGGSMEPIEPEPYALRSNSRCRILDHVEIIVLKP